MGKFDPEHLEDWFKILKSNSDVFYLRKDDGFCLQQAKMSDFELDMGFSTIDDRSSDHNHNELLSEVTSLHIQF